MCAQEQDGPGTLGDGRWKVGTGLRLVMLVICCWQLVMVTPSSAQSLEEAASCLASKDCAGSYGTRVRAMQGALVTLYEKALEEGQGKTHMRQLEDCLEKLNEVFRYHAADITLPGVEDVVKAAQSLLEDVCEGLCRETLSELEAEKRAWRGIWEDVQQGLFKRSEDWTRITHSLELGNVELMETMRSRLQRLLPE
ncbi:MAG: hypothetical protein IKN64_10970 [Desulfovibrio sp.]|nr:hypothetical protein [Desulfovibrio sp.]